MDISQEQMTEFIFSGVLFVLIYGAGVSALIIPMPFCRI
jgi:hypothetical protein